MQIICSKEYLDPDNSFTDEEFYKMIKDHNDNNRIKYIILKDDMQDDKEELSDEISKEHI